MQHADHGMRSTQHDSIRTHQCTERDMHGAAQHSTRHVSKAQRGAPGRWTGAAGCAAPLLCWSSASLPLECPALHSRPSMTNKSKMKVQAGGWGIPQNGELALLAGCDPAAERTPGRQWRRQIGDVALQLLCPALKLLGRGGGGRTRGKGQQLGVALEGGLVGKEGQRNVKD